MRRQVCRCPFSHWALPSIFPLSPIDESGRQIQWSGRLEGLLARHWPELTSLLKLESPTLLRMIGHYRSPARVSSVTRGRSSLDSSSSRKRPLVDHLNAILTSGGSKDQPGRFWSGEFFRQGDIDLPKLRRGASVKKWDWLRAETAKTLENQRSRRCLSQFFHSLGTFGDLGGAFIINPEADKADREYVQAVNERWTGIKEPHFRRCAVRARENTLPGVTVLAVGQVRAEIVLQCIKLGLINHLILDTDCADELQGLAR